jgi:hypothetical protein
MFRPLTNPEKVALVERILAGMPPDKVATACLRAIDWTIQTAVYGGDLSQAMATVTADGMMPRAVAAFPENGGYRFFFMDPEALCSDDPQWLALAIQLTDFS